VTQAPARPVALALANGEHGLFEGAEDDLVVFGGYRRTGTYAPELVSLIARLLRNGPGTLIDVGANIGLVAIPVLERTGAAGILFEPEPENHALLRRNLERHGLTRRCETHALALDSHEGRATLTLSTDNFGDHRLAYGRGLPERDAISVRTARLDDVLGDRELAAKVVLKLDCQGAEVRVLSGAERTLRRVDYAVVEYWPAGLLRMGDDAIALLQRLLDFPYAQLLLPGRPVEPLERSRRLFEQLAWIPIDGSDDGFFDLLLSRNSELPDARPR
jgi:FkbM family methyltransferase